ncbi:MAG: hypothetical protein JW893_08800 [Candidatus Omnitrophica bacterium]|nr:hypothetical protein [Candidatus Omnitrophota bacterium]
MKKNLLLVFFAVVFSFFLAEVALRIFNVEQPKMSNQPKEDWVLVPERVWTEHHPELGWYHQSMKHAFLPTTEGEVDVHTNRDGFRGVRDYSLEKQEGITRVLFLGDSFVFGYGVKDGEGVCAQLERLDSRPEVLNLGVPGYGIDQILMSYRVIGKKFHPDIVLIGVFPEQFWRATRAFADSGHAKPYFKLLANGDLVLKNVPVPQPFELTTNQYPILVERNPIELLLMKSEVYKLMRKGMLRLGKNLKILDPDLTDEWILGQAMLKQLITEIKESHSIPVLVVIPPDRWVKGERKFSLEKSLVRFADRMDVPFLDLTPIFRRKVSEEGLTKYYIQDDWHWTAEGHRLAAKSIYDYLIQQGYLKKVS